MVSREGRRPSRPAFRIQLLPLMQTHPGFARCILLPENRSALAAVQQLARAPDEAVNPLFLHGLAGSGKSCLVAALAEELPDRVVCTLSANAFPLPWNQDDRTASERYEEARRCDLLIVEDLQHLPARAIETLVQLLDERLRRRLPIVVTAATGPAQLAHRGEALPVRLTNRLASGLVVALQPLQTASRRLFLQEMARRRHLDIDDAILNWLAQALTGGRQLAGALNQIAALQALGGKRLTLEELQTHFAVQVDAVRPTVERIVRRVSDYYRVEPRQLRSARRQRRLLIARQVSMYLARRLTPLSLQQIGACFGGRDHTTVLHACRKVEEAMKSDAKLSGAVRQIHAELA
jgi:chromosomal replication initiator protein